MRSRMHKASTPQSWTKSKACFGVNPLAIDVDQFFTRLTSLNSIRFQSRLTGGDPGVFKLLRNVFARSEVYFVRRLAWEG